MFRRFMLYLGCTPCWVLNHTLTDDGNGGWYVKLFMMSRKWATDEDREKCRHEYVVKLQEELGGDTVVGEFTSKQVE